MLLVCPSCASTYNISEAKLGKGRTVRCKQCQACWYAAPAPPPDAFDDAIAPILAAASEAEWRALAPPKDETLAIASDHDEDRRDEQPSPDENKVRSDDSSDAEGKTAEADLSIEAEAFEPSPTSKEDDSTAPAIDGEVVARSARSIEVEPDERPAPAPTRPSLLARLMSRRRAGGRRSTVQPQTGGRRPSSGTHSRRSPIAVALPYLAFVLSCAAVLALTGRAPIMAAAPGTMRLYAALGLADAAAPVAIVTVRSEIGSADGGEVLLVEGELVSRARGTVAVPGLKVVVRDEHGVELYAWPAQSLKLALEPGERTVFRARLASPPPTGRTVKVTFESESDGAHPPRTS